MGSRSHKAIILLIGAAVLQPVVICANRWIPWEAGHKRDSGKTVLSTEGSPASNGLPQIYHFHRIQFEAVMTWREGDLLEVPSDRQQYLLYTLASDCEGPLMIDIRFSHELRPFPLKFVDGKSERVNPEVFISDYATDSDRFSPNQIAFEMKLFGGNNPVILENRPRGVDEEQPGMTFSHRPDIPWEDAGSAMEVVIDDGSAVGRPLSGNQRSSYLCATAFGDGAPSWDRIELKVSENTGAGTIKKGTQIRLLFSGGPGDRSENKIPATSDPVPPIVVLDTDEPLYFPVTGIDFAGEQGRCEGSSTGSPLLQDSSVEHLVPGNAATIDFALRPERSVPSIGFFNVYLFSQEFKNTQATAVFNFNEYTFTSLLQIMDAAWSRMPTHNPRRLPPGRPHWESSVALCDKGDRYDTGYTIPSGELKFVARHMNATRTLFGHVIDGNGVSRPAKWRQRSFEPTLIGELRGGLEGANDNLTHDVVGYEIESGGARPCLWKLSEDGWQRHRLPVATFAGEGRALDINDNGEACGFVDVLISAEPNRLPCFWKPEAGAYSELTVLPVPESAFSGSALALNNRGMIVGYYEKEGGAAVACAWEPSDTGHVFVDLETAGVARGINAIDQIVGGTDRKATSGSAASAMTWQAFQATRKVAPGGCWESLTSATS